jgi:hypothetical protein
VISVELRVLRREGCVYSFARVGAVLGMRVEDFYVQGRRGWVANHESARTTGLYDRRSDEISLDEVEKIVI